MQLNLYITLQSNAYVHMYHKNLNKMAFHTGFCGVSNAEMNRAHII